MSRDICNSKINLPNTFTNPLNLFHLFFPRENMKTLVRSTNTYAKIRIKQIFSIMESVKNRFSKWKSITIKEIYIFLAILIYINSYKQPSFSWYWKASNNSINSRPDFHRYMSLRRFSIIYKFFTIFPISSERPNKSHDLPRNRPTGRKYTSDAPPEHPH
jgi:hypothetical protein